MPAEPFVVAFATPAAVVVLVETVAALLVVSVVPVVVGEGVVAVGPVAAGAVAPVRVLGGALRLGMNKLLFSRSSVALRRRSSPSCCCC